MVSGKPAGRTEDTDMTNQTITVPQKSNAVIHPDIAAELARLRAENEALKAKDNSNPTPTVKYNLLGDKNKAGEDKKGTVSVYGFGRYPVTLYPKAWLKLFTMVDEIRAGIETNKARLAWTKSE